MKKWMTLTVMAVVAGLVLAGCPAAEDTSGSTGGKTPPEAGATDETAGDMKQDTAGSAGTAGTEGAPPTTGN